MQTITLDIFSGDWKINTAVVGLEDGKIRSVELLDPRHQPVGAHSAEVQREFWTGEYVRLGWTTTPETMIAKAIQVLLVDVDYVHESEDAWLDSAFDDRMILAGF